MGGKWRMLRKLMSAQEEQARTKKGFNGEGILTFSCGGSRHFYSVMSKIKATKQKNNNMITF